MESFTFAGTAGIVTGASSGIGRATALAFARQGANLAIIDVDSDGLTGLAREIERSGRRCLSIQCDVSREDEVKSAVLRTVEAFGRLDFAFNNAGIEGVSALTEDCTPENWTRIIDINLRGVWLCMKHQIPQMKRQRSGAIVNCSSIAGLVGFASAPAYTASKHGVVGLTKTAALECARSGVRVNVVCPGVIDTPMIGRYTRASPDAHAQLVEGEPMGRLGTPQEVADAVLWLASPQSSFVTGHALAVDGGWTAR